MQDLGTDRAWYSFRKTWVYYAPVITSSVTVLALTLWILLRGQNGQYGFQFLIVVLAIRALLRPLTYGLNRPRMTLSAYGFGYGNLIFPWAAMASVARDGDIYGICVAPHPRRVTCYFAVRDPAARRLLDDVLQARGLIAPVDPGYPPALVAVALGSAVATPILAIVTTALSGFALAGAMLATLGGSVALSVMQATRSLQAYRQRFHINAHSYVPPPYASQPPNTPQTWPPPPQWPSS